MENTRYTDAAESHDSSDSRFFNALEGAFYTGLAAFFVLPAGLRFDLAHRILEEKNFASTFQDGKFLPLHEKHNPAFMEAADKFKGFFERKKRQFGIASEVRAAIREENISYGALLKNQSLLCKSLTVILGLLGAFGFAKAAMHSEKSEYGVVPGEAVPIVDTRDLAFVSSQTPFRAPSSQITDAVPAKLTEAAESLHR